MSTRVLQEVVRFIHENAMRQPCPSSHDVQRWEHRSDVLHLLVVRLVRQVNDDAAIRVPQCSQQVARQSAPAAIPVRG